MRRALNDSPALQIAVVGFAALAFAIVLYTMVLSGDSETAEPQADPPASVEGSAADPAPAPAPATQAPSASVAVEELQPSKGLPQGVLAALRDGGVVALLVVERKATSDRRVAGYLSRLSRREDVVSFEVPADDIARYSRITSGVSVGRTPALVVVSSRDPNSAPTASVSYGFRDAKSVEVALEDALYEGGTRSASP